MGRRGFTLMEIVVVLFIISLVMALVMPSFRGLGEGALKAEVNRLASTLRYVYDEAVGKKQRYLFTINLDEGFWGFNGGDERRIHRLEDDVEIRDLVLPSRGKISEGEVILEFGPLGPDEPLILHLGRGEEEYTIIFNNLIGRVKVLEGYIVD